MSRNQYHLSLSGFIFFVLLAATPAASAQATLTWIGNQTNSGNVSGANNWLNGTAPANDTDYHFVFDAANLVSPGTNVPRTTAVWNRAVGVLSLSFAGNETYPAFTLSATSSQLLTFKGDVTVTSGDHILNSKITVDNDATWDIASGSSLARTGGANLLSLAADRTITKTGDGMLSLNTSNTDLLGTLEVQQGVLRVRTEQNTLGSATLALNGGVFEIFSNGALTNANATTTVIGESTVRLARDGEGAGQSHLMGALQLGSSKLTVTATADNTSGTAGVTYGATTLSNNATLEVVNGTAAATRVTLGAVGDAGEGYGLTKTGDGELLLTTAGTFSGGLTLSAGTLFVSHDSALGTGVFTMNGGIFASDGATARTISNAIVMGGNVQFGDATGTGELTLGSINLGGAARTFTVGNNTTLAGVVSNGDLAKAGTGTLFLNNADSSFGALSISAGRVDVQTNATITDLTGAGGTLGLSGGTLTLNMSTETLFTRAISGAGNLTKTGAGTLALNVANTGFSGTFEVQQGVLRVQTREDVLGSGTLALNGGVFEIFSNGARTNSNATTTVIDESTVRLSRSTSGAGLSHAMGALQIGSSKLTVTANDLNTSGTANVTYGATTLSNNATIEVVNNGVGTSKTRLTLGAVGETGGSRGLTKTGDGELLLGAASDYTGGTILDQGTLRLDHANAAGSGAITQATNTTLQINTTGTVANAMSIFNVQTLQTVTLSGNKTLNNATYDVTNGTTTTEQGVLSGDGGLTKEGGGTLVLNGGVNNTYEGATEVNAGSLVLSNSGGNAIHSSSGITVNSGGTLVLGADNQIGDGIGLTLNGGTFLVGALNVTEKLGTLTLSASSTIDFGDFGNNGLRQVTFDDSSSIAWTGTLTITNWQGVAQTSSDFTRLVFGVGGLNTNQLGQIVFASQGINGGELIGGGELAPIPEAPVVWGAAAVALFIVWRERRRLRLRFVFGAIRSKLGQ